MALWLFNLSVDPPDNIGSEIVVMGHLTEDLSINDMETISEIVLEKILGFEEAVPEGDEEDGPSSLPKMAKVVYTIASITLIESDVLFVEELITPHVLPLINHLGDYGWIADILIPPPNGR
jgi:hypothetical protein